MRSLYIRLTVCFIALLITTKSYAQQYQWATGGGTTDDLVDAPGIGVLEGTYYMCTDPNGNVYALSEVGNNPIYADTFYQSAAYGDDHNFMITSYTCSGQMRWAKLVGSSDKDCAPEGIVCDASGHIYVAGQFPDGILHIGADTTLTASTDVEDGLMQFDTSGHFNWIRYVGNYTFASLEATYTDVVSLALDGADNLHFMTYIASGGVLMAGDTSHYGNYDLKYNASGTLLSAKRMQLDSTIAINGIAFDKQTNIMYAYGARGLQFISPEIDSSIYSFISAFDTGDHLKWLDTLGNTVNPGNQVFGAIIPDGKGHLYVCADAQGNMLYRGETIPPPVGAAGSNIAAVFKLDTVGNLLWTSQCNSEYLVQYWNIAMGPNNKLAAIGFYNGNMNAKTITGETVTFATAANASFFSVLDTAGNIFTVQDLQGGDSYYNTAHCVTSDKIGNFYVGGLVSDSIPDTIITPYHSVGGETDFYVLKYGVDCDCTSMPAANYTETVTGTSTASFTYTGTTTPAIDSIMWVFGDGASSGDTATGTTAAHTYTTVGRVKVLVMVFTGCGYDIHAGYLVVNCTGAVTASFTDTGSTIRGFTYTGTAVAIDSVVWNYGDGHKTVSTGSALNTMHTYSASGTYTVCASAYSACGSNTSCQVITVSCVPVSAFTHTGTDPLSFTYTGTTIPTPDTIAWSFGDGATATGVTETHTYTASGTYSVCVTDHTVCGSNTHCTDIVVNCSPTSSFTYSGSDPLSFVYTGTTLLEPDTTTWSFGDGATATGLTTSHTYTASGTYSACATAHTACGSNTHCTDINVNCTPAASFTQTGDAVRDFTYTGTTPELDSIVWNFGDGTTSTGTTAEHTYTVSAAYTVCVTAYGLCGSNTSCTAIVVDCTPVSNYTFTGISTITFTYTGTTIDLDSVLWIFGDGTTAVGLTTVHAYSTAATWGPCAEAFTTCGNDFHCGPVTVPCIVNAAFTDTGNNPVTYTYTGTTAGVDSIVWRFGDGTTANIAITGSSIGTVTHHYTTNGNYNVCVTVYNSCGMDSLCSDVAVGTEGVAAVSVGNISVYPNPAGDKLNIAGVTDNTTYRLLSLAGMCIQKGALHTGTNTMAIANIASGVYVLELTDSEGMRDIVRVVKE